MDLSDLIHQLACLGVPEADVVIQMSTDDVVTTKRKIAKSQQQEEVEKKKGDISKEAHPPSSVKQRSLTLEKE